jgi:NitT/TauT family transport system substrate-binding protein
MENIKNEMMRNKMTDHERGMLVFCLFLFCSCMMRGEKFVFTTAWTPQAEFAGYYVAKEKGFYKEAGLDVDIRYPSLTSSVYHRLETDECDAGMFSMVSAIKMIASGAPLVNILQTSMNSSCMLVSRWGKDPMKEKGKRLAVYVSDPNYLAFIMDRKQQTHYEWVFFTENINVFLSGAVDMMSAVSYNEYILLKQAGFEMSEKNIFRFKDHGYNIQENGVYVKRDYYDTHREQVARFAEASKRGWEWTAAHPDQALDIVMKYVREGNVQTNRVIQKLMLAEILRLQKDSDSGKREFRVRPDMVKKASSLMKDFGMIDREVTYQELMGQTPKISDKKK